MEINEKDLTIIVPTYKADKYLKENIDMWKLAASLFNVVIVEDGSKESLTTASKLGAKYIWKENGNWGSVINFAKKLNIKTKYTMIVDADDEIKIDNLLDILRKSKGSDVLLTGVDDVDYITGKSRTRFASLKNPKNTFIHTIIFKTKIFKKIQDIQEGIPHQDHHVVFQIFKNSESFEEFRISPYKYFYNIQGQSISSVPNNYGEIVSTYKDIVGDDLTTKYIQSFTAASIIWYTKDKELRKIMLKKYKKIGNSKYMPFFGLRITSLFRKNIK